jgi:hypothetical protein
MRHKLFFVLLCSLLPLLAGCVLSDAGYASMNFGLDNNHSYPVVVGEIDPTVVGTFFIKIKSDAKGENPQLYLSVITPVLDRTGTKEPQTARSFIDRSQVFTVTSTTSTPSITVLINENNESIDSFPLENLLAKMKYRLDLSQEQRKQLNI